MDWFSQKGYKPGGDLRGRDKYQQMMQKKKTKKKPGASSYNSAVYGSARFSKNNNDKNNIKKSKSSDDLDDDLAFGPGNQVAADFNYLMNGDGEKHKNSDGDGFDSDDLKELGINGLGDRGNTFDDINNFLQENKSTNIQSKAVMQDELDRIKKNFNNSQNSSTVPNSQHSDHLGTLSDGGGGVGILGHDDDHLLSDDDNDDLPGLGTRIAANSAKQNQTIEALKNFFENDAADIKKTRAKYPDNMYPKYGNKKFPAALTAKQVAQRAESLIKRVVPRVVNGQAASKYYDRAKQVCEGSHKAVLGGKELSQLNWNEFSAGYFGSDVQQLISQQVAKTFPDLRKLRNRNKGAGGDFFRVRDFWGLDFFSLYILAPEIAAYLAKDDFHVSLSEAYEILRDTNDYGRFIVDRKNKQQKQLNLASLKEVGGETLRKRDAVLDSIIGQDGDDGFSDSGDDELMRMLDGKKKKEDSQEKDNKKENKNDSKQQKRKLVSSSDEDVNFTKKTRPSREKTTSKKDKDFSFELSSDDDEPSSTENRIRSGVKTYTYNSDDEPNYSDENNHNKSSQKKNSLQKKKHKQRSLTDVLHIKKGIGKINSTRKPSITVKPSKSKTKSEKRKAAADGTDALTSLLSSGDEDEIQESSDEDCNASGSKAKKKGPSGKKAKRKVCSFRSDSNDAIDSDDSIF